jgi:hypothetical protein
LAREGHNLPSNSSFVAVYRDWLLKNGSGANLVRLITAFLRYFPADNEFREDWRRFLVNALVKDGGRRLALWKERQKEFGLLLLDGPHRFARRLLSDPPQQEELLKKAGLTGFLYDSEFARVVQWSLVKQISEYFSINSRLTRSECEAILSLLENGRGNLIFEDLRIRVAETLLLQWETRSPPEPVKEAVRAFLQRHFGNPNIQIGRWSGVGEVARRIFLRWLAEDALDTFFEILDRTALDRQWRARKAFWAAYLKEDLISDAWLALGPAANVLAARTSELSGGSWGALQGASANQSVLLLKIRNITIMEWSHEGAARMWLDGNKNAPILYKRAYSAYRLRAVADERIVHDQNLRWRIQTAKWIRDQTGLNPHVFKGAR